MDRSPSAAAKRRYPAEGRPARHRVTGIANLALAGKFCYAEQMKVEQKALTAEQVAEAKALRLTAMHLQAIESNPLDADDVALFEMFEREGWPHERRRAYLLERAKIDAMIPAAE